MLFDSLYPTKYYESSYIIDYEKLYEKGYRGIIYDLDNTLVPHGAPADERALELMDRLKSIGYTIFFLSNNRKERVEMFNEKIGALYLCKASKPNKRGYLKAAEMMNLDPSKILVVGDQIFTDIWGANMAGMRSCLVMPIDRSSDEIQIVIKRMLEKVVLIPYLKKNKIIS
ncbi:MAG: YqeG family HAD IIIA-type phosphatase [Lachnospiraceae bacterium]|nr:YqeG family HAD IIIA-type phosphatase [Lachnospiraceae bacterium]MCR4865373.1 YqeG family HAD IIIA-type phosphatase [Lachnospiraceae bacterium]